MPLPGTVPLPGPPGSSCFPGLASLSLFPRVSILSPWRGCPGSSGPWPACLEPARPPLSEHPRCPRGELGAPDQILGLGLMIAGDSEALPWDLSPAGRFTHTASDDI